MDDCHPSASGHWDLSQIRWTEHLGSEEQVGGEESPGQFSVSNAHPKDHDKEQARGGGGKVGWL
jgi:hypothetical protein